jgi:succinoglycan biosynthesis transport protein ExoP
VDLRHYIAILRRQKWLIVEAVVIVAVVAGVLSNLKTPVYEASARVLLRPNDPAEQLYPGYTITGFTDPDRYVAAQIDIIESTQVAAEAAKALKGGTPESLLGEVRARQVGTSDMIAVTGRSVDPERARDVANAFARAYIENRRQFAVAGLKRAADDIAAKLAELERQIARYDALIADGGVQPGATTQLQRPAGPGTPGPTPPNIPGPTGTGLDPGGQPTTNEALKAARYAAATQYQSLYFRQQELLVDINLKRGEAELVEAATTPTSPVSPKPVRDGVLGAFLGLLLGLGVAFLREQVDDRIRSREEAEEAAGAPVLAELPVDEEAARTPGHLAVADAPLGPFAEAVRALRTSVQFLGVESPLRTIVVTSPEPGDGKTAVAANLAAAFAQAGFRTVLVSSDLRRPRIEQVVPPERPMPGLTGVLAYHPRHGAAANGAGATPGVNGDGPTPGAAAANGEVHPAERPTVAAALNETALARLQLLPAGARPPNPAELLGSRRMREVIDDLSRLVDVMVFDTPPLLAVTDAAVLAGRADGVLLVAAAGETHRGALARARAMLDTAGARVVGVVLNRVDASAGYYGGYGYGYAAYYGEPEPAGRRRRIPIPRRRGRAARPSAPAEPEPFADVEPEPVRAGVRRSRVDRRPGEEGR